MAPGSKPHDRCKLKPPTQARLKEVFRYEPDTGVFIWLISTARRIKVGTRAGSLNGDGYRFLSVDGLRYRASHLAWLYVYGVYPTTQIDHENLRPGDDRIGNLRPATSSNNIANSPTRFDNRSGYKGVSVRRGRYIARIRIDGALMHLGCFGDPATAHAAYCEAATRYFGKFARFS